MTRPPAAPATEAAAVRKLAEHIIAREQAWRVDQQDPPGLRDGHRRPSSSALDLARSSLALVSLVAAAEQQRDEAVAERLAYAQAGLDQLDRHRSELEIVMETRKRYVTGWMERAEAAEEELRKWEAHIYPHTYAEALDRVAAAERRAAETEAALRMMVESYERHEEWCGNLATAPGASIHWQAINAARAALSAGGPERTTT